jgi:Mor family transcriptional regulator
VFDFLKNFYNYDVNGGKLVSDRVLEDNWNVAAGASAIGNAAVRRFVVEDCRQDIAKNTVPTLMSKRPQKLTSELPQAILPFSGGPCALLATEAPGAYRDGRSIYSPTGTLIGTVDNDDKWIAAPSGESLGYLAP